MANHIWVGVKDGVYTVAEFPFSVGSWKRECKETNPLIELVRKDGTPKNPIRKDKWDNYWLLLNAPEELTEDVKMGRPIPKQPMCNTCWNSPAVKLVTVPSGTRRWKCQHCIDASKPKRKVK